MSFIHTVLDFILHIDAHLAQLVAAYGGWVYAVLFIILCCETGLVVAPFLPGDSLLFVAGTLAALPSNSLNVHMMVLVMLGAAILGDAVNYSVGHFLGQRLFQNPNARLLKRQHLERTQAFYQRHGGKTVIIARFVPIVRTFAPFIAGMGGMRYRRFLAYNVLGALMWVLLLTYAGYFFGTAPWVQRNLTLVIMGIIVISVLPGAIEFVRQRLSRERQTGTDAR